MPPGEEVVVLVSVVMWSEALAALFKGRDFVLLDDDELIWLVFECSEFNVLSNLLSFSILVGKSHVSVGIKSERVGSSVPDED